MRKPLLRMMANTMPKQMILHVLRQHIETAITEVENGRFDNRDDQNSEHADSQ